MKNLMNLKRRSGLPGMNPTRDWVILLSVFSLAVLGCFAASVSVFYSVGSGSPAPSDAISADSEKLLDPKAISSVTKAYESAPGKIQNFVSGGDLLVDPSR